MIFVLFLIRFYIIQLRPSQGISSNLTKLLYCQKRPYIRVIPQGTVDNNLRPDRLEGPKALDPNYFRLPTCQDIPPTHTINVAHLT